MSISTVPVQGQGFRPFLERHLRTIVGNGTLPQTKIEHIGFLNLLQSQNKPQVLRLNTAGGHREAVQVKYLQRYTEDFTGTSEASVCNNVLFDPYHETSATLTSFRFIPLHLDDEVVAQYEDEASGLSSAGTPSTTIMNEMVERVMMAGNAILSGVRTDLLTQLVGNIGINRVTGSAASQTLNITQNTTNLPLTDGLTKLLNDYDINLGTGVPQIVGAGLFNAFMQQQRSKTYSQAGYNTAIDAAGVKWFFDQKCSTLLGANDILVIQPNATQIVEYLQYTGFKAGAKPGASVYGTIKLPMQMGMDVVPVDFDYQLKYVDCPTPFTDQYYGTSSTLQKGYNLILSKKCGLFQIPSDAYRGTDPMGVNNNGVYRYTITNV